jgi:hypothetical protein
MNEPFDPVRLSLLITQVVDGVPTAEERSLLLELLSVSEEARRFYVEQMLQRAMLIEDIGGIAGSGQAAPASLLGDFPTPPTPVVKHQRDIDVASIDRSPIADSVEPADAPLEAIVLSETAESAAPVKSPVLGFLGGVMDYISHSRMVMLWLIGGSLVLYFAVQWGSLMFSRLWEQNAAQVAGKGGAGVEKHGQPGDRPGLATDGKIVARLSNAVDCQWKFSRADGTNRIDRPQSVALEIGTEFHAGQKLNLATGLAELTFESGAKVILHAPAQFDVADALGGSLARGKLTAKVPHSASGFTVGTPGGKVVDLGTEFGVQVGDDGATDVIVYVGEVQVESGAGGDSGAGVADGPKVVHVKAGEAVTVGPDRIVKAIPPENERFVRELAPLGDPAKGDAAYVEFVKSLKPVVWFRMEGKETDRVLHDEMGGRDAKLLWDGPGNPFVKGRVGKALWLRGDMLKDYAIVPDYPKAEHGKLTVAACVYAHNRTESASILKNWATAPGQFYLGLHPSDGGGSGDLCAQLGQRDSAYISLREGGTHQFPTNEWQHVALVVDGSMARLYRNGGEVAAVKCSELKFPVSCAALGVGAKANDAGTAATDDPRVGYWDGLLDEIIICNDALSAQQIRKLAGSTPR